MNRLATHSREGLLAAVILLVGAMLGVIAATNGAVAIVLPIMLVGGLMLLVWPVLGLFLLAATIPVESALMFGGVSAPRFIGMAVFGAWGAQKLLRREPLGPLVSSRLIQVSLLLLALACLSLIWAQYPAGVSTHLFLLFQLILLAILISDLASSWERVAWVMKLIVLAASVAAIMTLDQYFTGGVRRAGEGIVGSINRTSITLVAILPFAFYLVRSRETALWRLVGLAYIGLASVAVAATLSRMNYLVLPLVLIVHLVLMTTTRVGRRRVIVLGAAVMIAASFLPMEAMRDRAESIMPYLSQTLGEDDGVLEYSGRGFHLLVGIHIFRDHPIIGAGYRNYGPHFLTYQWNLSGAPQLWRSPRSPHSSHIGFLANLGVVGFLLWIGIFAIGFSYLRSSWRGVRDPQSDQALMIQAVAVALGLQFLYGFYGEIHQDKILWVILGLLLAVHTLTRSERPEEVLEARPQRGHIVR